MLHLKNTANLCSAQLISIHCFKNEDNFLPGCLNAFGRRVLSSQECPCSYEYSVYVYADMISWKKPQWQNTSGKIAYQSVIKRNACALNEICMTNWLWRTQSRKVLWTFAQKLIEIPFIMTVALPRNRQREGHTGKEEYNDFWLQRQEKPCIIHWKIITKNYAISPWQKAHKDNTRRAFGHFIYKRYCLPRFHSIWYILHTETC